MMPDSREIPDLDLEGSAASDIAPYACEICGQPVPVGTAGRKPRVMLCAEHRKARTGTTSGSTAGARAGSSHERIATGMTALHAMVGFGIGLVAIPTGDPVWHKDRDIIGANSGNIGEQWAKYCDDNPKMRKAILSFLETVGALSIAAAYAPVVIAITVNHKTASAPKPAPVPAAPTMPQAPPTPFQQPMRVAPEWLTDTPVDSTGAPLFQPTSNGNGLPFATDIIE